MHGSFIYKRSKEVLKLLMLFTVLAESNRKLNKVWVNKGSGFYNRSIKSWLEKKCYGNVFNS